MFIRAVPAILALAMVTDAANLFRKKLSKDDRVLHALNRLTFGPRPGDAERVKSLGLDRWIDQQLSPERITENPALEKRLAPLETLRLSTEEMVAKYPPPQVLRAASRNKSLLPSDPQERARFERLIEQMERRRESKGRANQKAGRPNLRELLTPEQRARLREAAPGKRGEMLQALMPEVRRQAMVERSPQLVVASDLVESKLQRSLYSNRQLEEVLVDFWFNHFNVYMNKGADRFLLTSYERDAIRPHVLGKFKDLVVATAKHPAMLFYLDNWQSVDPQPGDRIRQPARRRAVQVPQNRRPRGLNENYGRELLELHTLGVDGGYTQQDVTEVARCFTGWTIRQPNLGGDFFFAAMRHDRGEKTVLGHKIPAGGGIEDGLKVIDLLASHPSTARHISTRLAQRFVADNPPKSLVDRMAETFRKSGGDIREVMRTMIRSKEFFSEGAYRAKLKSPFEWVVSAARAMDADVSTALALSRRIDELGQPLYRKEEPTGYSNNGEDWVNTSGLLGRMNLGLAMAAGDVPGVRVDGSRWAGKAPAEVAGAILFQPPSVRTREAIAKGIEGKQATPELIAGLVIGSPDFQRR